MESLSLRCVQVLCVPHRSVVVCLVLIPPLSRELVLPPCVCSYVLRRILMWVCVDVVWRDVRVRRDATRHATHTPRVEGAVSVTSHGPLIDGAVIIR